jgi:hypothetical protein
MYNLSDETLEKLGLNPDLSEKTEASEGEKEEVKVDERGIEVIREYGDELGINIGDEFKKTNDTKKDANEDKSKGEEKETPGDKDSKEQPEGKEQEKPNSEGEGEGDSEDEEPPGPTFSDKVAKLISEKFADEGAQTKFLADLENYEKFMASNTTKAQDISNERKKLDSLIEKLGAKEVQENIEAVLGLDDLKDFLESADEWYGGAENNKIRFLIDALEGSSKEIKKYSSEKSALSEEKANLELEKEILAVQRLSKEYEEPEKLQELGNLADKYGVDLATAHELRASNQRAERVKEMTTEKETLENEIKTLKSELKKRNKELSDAKAKIPVMDSGVNGKGAIDYDFATPSSGLDETESRVKKMLGVE